MADRVFITDEDRAFVDKMKEENILGIKENIDAYLLAVALGINSVQNYVQTGRRKTGYIETARIKDWPEERTLMGITLLGTAESDKDYDEYADFDKKIVPYCDKCAEIGFSELRKIVDKADWDKVAIETNLMNQIGWLYEKKVKGNIE